MPRARNVPATRRRHKKFLKAAKGFFQGRRKLYKTARETVERGWYFSYRDRKAKKRHFRALWIQRINAACRPYGITYSRLISALKKANVQLDRRSLSELAARDGEAFKKVIEVAAPGLMKSA